jgi:hypothetical protein
MINILYNHTYSDRVWMIDLIKTIITITIEIIKAFLFNPQIKLALPLIETN